MKKQMKIVLKSDLCAAVGKNYSAMIDLDTALDEYGLPYIPSRRLKGCMREAAELIGISDIDEIFGASGKELSGCLKIENAYIENYQNTALSLKDNDISHEEVTDLFCSVRQQTAIDKTGTAKDKSLRFIRVVNEYQPDSNAPMEFYAKISFDDNYKADVKNICRALRNIGYQRNRGLGAVDCSLVDDNSGFKLAEYDFDTQKEYELKYTIFLDGDLMLPASDSAHSLDYIPGTAVLGALAASYAGDDFNDVFLSGKVKFGNLYISDPEGHEFIPAPRFLAKIKAPVIKEDEGIKNIIGADRSKKQYKILKTEYVNSEFGCRKPERKIVYHNSLKDKDAGLYMQYCICKGQYFSGSIFANGEYMEKIYPLFKTGKLNFGKSKTAQYSACSLVQIEPFEVLNDTFTAQSGVTVAFVLKSDVMLTNEKGICTPTLSVLQEKIEDKLGVRVFEEKLFNTTDYSSLTTKIISGYNAKWNLKKPQITVLSAGSVIVAKMSSNLRQKIKLPNQITIGEKQNEGYGCILIINKAENFNISEKADPAHDKVSTDLVDLVYKRRQDDRLLALAVKYADEIFKTEADFLNSSQIGRILLMCKESKNAVDYKERLDSIKTDKTREKAIKYFSIESVKAFDAELQNITDWMQQQRFLTDYLTVCKYKLKSIGE